MPVAAGHSREQLDALINEAPDWSPAQTSDENDPVSLRQPKAKARAIDMATGCVRDRAIADPIRRLNFLRALAEDIPEPDA